MTPFGARPEPGRGRAPITPQLALRVAIIGGLAVFLFAVVFFRLWYLQVLSGDEYVTQANDNRVREVKVQAPRGDIVDREGRTIVTNKQATVVQIRPNRLPPEGAPRKRLYRKLARVLGDGTTARRIQQEVVEQRALLPYANVTVKTDVDPPVLQYLSERAASFPGVEITTKYLRKYPYGRAAAHVVGYVGEITEAELEQERFDGVQQGTVVGKAGVEERYDEYLRGRDGADLLQVDSLGRPKGRLRRRDPVAGRQLKLSLDLGLQRAARKAFVDVAQGRRGAYVALDPRNGEVLATGSYPDFKPSTFARPVSTRKFKALNSEANGAPLFDRAIGGQYPTGSTFKPITALAGLSSGRITTDTVIQDNKDFRVGAQTFTSPAAAGPVALRRAMQVSSDVFFYQIGAWLNTLRPRGGEIQRWARRLNLGRSTGIDIPGEVKGNIPDPQWRQRQNEAEAACREKRGRPCGIADGTNRPWSIGDSVQLAIGQGDVVASPLQNAVLYSALGNAHLSGGGRMRVVRPRLGQAIEDSRGRLVQELNRPASRSVKADPGWIAAINEGLRLASSASGGTSADVFQKWPQGRLPVFGKTGTAQRTGQADQSWYTAFVPSRARPIAVAVTVEKGGFGATTAAPIACRMLRSWYDTKAPCAAGDSRTN